MLEEDRRVLGNLSEPRTLVNLTRVLQADAHSPFERHGEFNEVRDDVERVLVRLQERGLVASIGQHNEAKSVLRALRENPSVIELPKAKADALLTLLDSPRDPRLGNGGELHILTKSGFEALTA